MQSSDTSSIIHNKRVGFIDIAKGIGMLTIIWGHISLANLSHSIVYSFHIPLFFFLSGYVFSPKRYSSFGVFMKKRFYGLVVPYLLYSFLTWIVWATFMYVSHTPVDSYWMPLLQTFLSQGSEGYLVHNVPLWFVMCLFTVEIIYFFLAKSSKCIVIIISIALGILGVLSTKAEFFDFSTLPWSLDVSLMALPFYTAGNLLSSSLPANKQVEFVKTNKGISVLVILLAFVIVYFGAKYNGSPSMGHAFLGKYPWLFYFVASFGVLGVVFASMLIESLPGLFSSFFVWMGLNSFRVMAVHNPIKGIVVILVARMVGVSTLSVCTSTPFSILAFIVTLVITVATVYIISVINKKAVGIVKYM